ncbi:MAG: GDSL family lipase [Muribaculaceae bacterium]|nr:GDSL family lipase [Muribaculaceae bacterium]
MLTTVPMTHAEKRNEYWRQKVSLFELLPISSDDIVMLGNSITDGGEWVELLGRDNVKNRGISADVISGVEERLDQVTNGHPDKIFLLIGINDISHGHSAAELARRYERLLKRITTDSPDTKIYIQSVMPINNSFGRYRNLAGKEKVVTQLNTLLKQLAPTYNAVWVDLWPALADSKGRLRSDFTNDGLHLTGKGYKAWAETIIPFIDQ